MIVDLDALAANGRAWRAIAGGRRVYAVVKADGYGIGTERVVRALEEHVDAWCVTNIVEARAVRAISPKRIVCIAWLPTEHLAEAVALGVEISIASTQDARALDGIAASRGSRIRAQVAVRSVAGWVGVGVDEAEDLARVIVSCRGIDVVEAWTHLSGEAESTGQVTHFMRTVAAMQNGGLIVDEFHVASTAPTIWFDGSPVGQAVRIGIGLFGSAMAMTGRRPPALEHVVHVHGAVERVDRVPAGVGVGYGSAYTTRQGDRLVTIRFGYSDGMPRAFVAQHPTVTSKRSELRVVAMGMQFLTCLGDAEVGSSVEVVGSHHPLDEVAALAGVLPHELLLSLAQAARAAGALVDSSAGAGYTTCGDSR